MIPASPLVSVCIPTLNEATTIAAVIADAWAAAQAAGFSCEVVVADGGSTDDTVAAARAAGATVIASWIPGYGACCLRAAEAAGGEYLLFVDGDGTYPLAALHRFIEPLRAGYDLVIGTRRNGRMAPGAMSWAHRHLLEPLQTALFRRRFGFHVSDVRCGLRAMRRSVFATLGMQGTGMEFSAEMLRRAGAAGAEVMEVPVAFQPRETTPARRAVGDSWRVLRQILLLSPTDLFVVPGLALALVGFGIEGLLVRGPVDLGPWHADYHLMFVGSACAVLGLQILLLGVFAKTYALVANPADADAWIRRLHAWYTLERGVVVGLAVGAAGLGVNLTLAWQWYVLSNRGLFFAVQPAILALTLMVCGTEIVFASFFLSILRSRGYGHA